MLGVGTYTDPVDRITPTGVTGVTALDRGCVVANGGLLCAGPNASVVGLDDAEDLDLVGQAEGACALSASRGLMCWGATDWIAFGPDGLEEDWDVPRVCAGFNH